MEGMCISEKGRQAVILQISYVILLHILLT